MTSGGIAVAAATRRRLRAIVTRPLLEVTVRRPSPRALRLLRRWQRIQLTEPELVAVIEEIRSREHCQLLVFGLGHDSTLWRRVNDGGRTVFLEADQEWFERVRRLDPRLDAHLVAYHTVLTDWPRLLDHPEQLELDVPATVAVHAWDVVLVDGPEGHADHAPGRMQSIVWAADHAPDGVVFVHDCHRDAEAAYCDRYLAVDRDATPVSYVLRRFGPMRR